MLFRLWAIHKFCKWNITWKYYNITLCVNFTKYLKEACFTVIIQANMFLRFFMHIHQGQLIFDYCLKASRLNLLPIMSWGTEEFFKIFSWRFSYSRIIQIVIQLLNIFLYCEYVKYWWTLLQLRLRRSYCREPQNAVIPTPCWPCMFTFKQMTSFH